MSADVECVEGRESGGLEEVVTTSSAIIAIKQLARSQQKVKLVAKLSCSLNQVPRDRRLRRSEPVQ